jgi:hypothetical protein
MTIPVRPQEIDNEYCEVTKMIAAPALITPAFKAQQLAASVQPAQFFNIFGDDNAQYFLDGKEVMLKKREVVIAHRHGKPITDELNYIAKGGCKKIIQFGDDVVFIPNVNYFEITALAAFWQQWQIVIQDEKRVADELIAIGLRTQQFKMTRLKVCDPLTKQVGEIDVITGKSYECLQKEENLSLLEYNSSQNHGQAVQFYNADPKNMFDSAWNQQLFQTLCDDIINAQSHRAPLGLDSLNFIFQHPKAPGTPGQSRLFLADFGSKRGAQPNPRLQKPMVPTLKTATDLCKGIIINVLAFVSPAELRALGVETPMELAGIIIKALDQNGTIKTMVDNTLANRKPRLAL